MKNEVERFGHPLDLLEKHGEQIQLDVINGRV